MTTPKMPDTVLVGSLVYAVTCDEDSWARAVADSAENKGGYGLTNNRRGMIALNPDQPESIRRLTLWHEVLHALCEGAMGSPDWLNLGEEDSDREERVIRMFEAPTLNVIRDNPTLLAYLTAGD